jgi:hypothetical protein
VNRLRRKGDATLQQKATDLVDQCGATLHESIPHPVHGLPVELLLGLICTKRMFCFATASATASASMKSFLFDFRA